MGGQGGRKEVTTRCFPRDGAKRGRESAEIVPWLWIGPASDNLIKGKVKTIEKWEGERGSTRHAATRRGGGWAKIQWAENGRFVEREAKMWGG